MFKGKYKMPLGNISFVLATAHNYVIMSLHRVLVFSFPIFLTVSAISSIFMNWKSW
jgi:hypothetical protein